MAGEISRRALLKAGGLALVAAPAAVRALPTGEPFRQTSDRRIRIGVVGGGFGCSFHWHEHPNCQVIAVSDLIPERRDRLVQTYGCNRPYESLEKLILDPEVEAVAVFTEATNHARHVIACMNAGKHVISAVPACCSLEEALQIREVKEKTGLTYMMAETSHYRWETITARRLYLDGMFGELAYCEAEYYHPMTGAERESLWFRDGKPTWRYAYPPMLYPTHTNSFLVSVTGERIARISCIGWGNGDPALKDNAYQNPFTSEVAMAVTDRGRGFRSNVCWSLHAHGERAQWFGTEGAFYMDGSGGQPFRGILKGGAAIGQLPDYWHMVPEKMRRDSGHGRSHPFLTHEFVMALVEKRAPEVDLYESLAMTVPGIVAHQSALKGGEQLAVPSFDPPRGGA
ncbi:MAG: Gfo/Idh/MocA family oxidoreductase [Armatimonadetes bacterium]|nr:Gfo/Idh/MocA family oxidoreductase [Armatimonadota bacterium]